MWGDKDNYENKKNSVSNPLKRDTEPLRTQKINSCALTIIRHGRIYFKYKLKGINAMSEKSEIDADSKDLKELLKIHGRITDDYQTISDLIVQLSILIDSYYAKSYDTEATVDCIGYTINDLYNHSLKEQELIRQTAEIRNKIFLNNVEMKK